VNDDASVAKIPMESLRCNPFRFVLLMSLICLPHLLWAQSAANSGQIAGEILDPSGAAVAGVEVSVRNVDTNY